MVENGRVGGVKAGGAFKGRDRFTAVALPLVDLADERVDHEGVRLDAGGGLRGSQGLGWFVGVEREAGEAEVTEPGVGLPIEPGGFLGFLVEFVAPAEVVERRGVMRVAGQGLAELCRGAVAAANVVEIVAAEGVVGVRTLGEEGDGCGCLKRKERLLAGEVVGVGEQENGVAITGIAGFGGTELADSREGIPLPEELLGRVVNREFERLRGETGSCDDEAHHGTDAD